MWHRHTKSANAVEKMVPVDLVGTELTPSSIYKKHTMCKMQWVKACLYIVSAVINCYTTTLSGSFLKFFLLHKFSHLKKEKKRKEKTHYTNTSPKEFLRSKVSLCQVRKKMTVYKNLLFRIKAIHITMEKNLTCCLSIFTWCLVWSYFLDWKSEEAEPGPSSVLWYQALSWPTKGIK